MARQHFSCKVEEIARSAQRTFARRKPLNAWSHLLGFVASFVCRRSLPASCINPVNSTEHVCRASLANLNRPTLQTMPSPTLATSIQGPLGPDRILRLNRTVRRRSIKVYPPSDTIPSVLPVCGTPFPLVPFRRFVRSALSPVLRLGQLRCQCNLCR